VSPGAPPVAIVGGGYCGTAVALHVLAAGRPVDVALLDRRGAFARGLAYGTSAREHVLNVPASRMSALADQPGDLLAWLTEQGVRPDPDAFLPRRDYGRYLEQRLARAREAGVAHGAGITTHATAAVDLVPRDHGAALVTADGRRIEAARVVLALGNLPPADPLARVGGERLDAARYTRDAWTPGALDGLPHDAPVLLLGTGLTCVDVVLSLKNLRHRGPLTALSRRGLLPRPQHGPGRPYGGGYDPARVAAAAGDLVALLRALRAEVRRHEAAGGSWRDVIAALRPLTPRLWRSLSERDRDRFLRHVRPFWDVHRHRMAPAIEDALAGLWATGAFVERAGRIDAVRPTADGVEVRWRPRGRAETETLHVGRVINATGASPDLRTTADPFVRALRERGWIRPDPRGLGLETDADGRVLAAQPALPPCVFALGPLRIGTLWESTAVPELRVQARDLAARLLRA
jgi:uncharacterized NAD(P)/FAD-binding protein YdhS